MDEQCNYRFYLNYIHYKKYLAKKIYHIDDNLACDFGYLLLNLSVAYLHCESSEHIIKLRWG